MTKTKNKDGLAMVCVGAAACVACCTGPILGVLGAIGLTGLASSIYIGFAGLFIAAIAARLWIAVKRRRSTSTCATPPDVPVSVAAPGRRAPASQR